MNPADLREGLALLNCSSTPIVIIGAGPYGLSISANLRARQVDHRIFGVPMNSWIEHMPVGMYLKSVGFASNLSDGLKGHTLRSFCEQTGREYADDDWPIPISTFTDYGLWFQQKVVPDVESAKVVSLQRTTNGFELELDTGERVNAAQVVLAVGHAYFPRLPEELAGLPEGLVSHAMDHKDFANFAGRDVTVIGGGQSALETAALLHEAGARVRVLVRGLKLDWNPDPFAGERTLKARLRYPKSGLGAGWDCYFYSNAPAAFYHLPYATRMPLVKQALGPAGAWWLRPRVLEHLNIETRTAVSSASPDGDAIKLATATAGGVHHVRTDHIVAGTGYSPDIQRIDFLSPELARAIRQINGAPVLDTGFESSVPGLYFAGLIAAPTFGPVQRFVYGANFAARRISQKVSKTAFRNRRLISRFAGIRN